MYNKIDLTLLKPNATYWNFYNLCETALENNCASVCIPSAYVKEMREQFPNLKICTVVGFPLGNSTTETKVTEATKAIIDGADEIDMVINISNFIDGYYIEIRKEIDAVKEAIGNHTLKVIIETCYLTKKQIRLATKIINFSDADYIKTSTGFGTGGATFEDVELIKRYTTKKIKASGGIRTKKEVEKYIELGCDRIGMSCLPK